MPKVTTGIDLGNETIKVVSLSKDGDVYSLINIGMYAHHGDADKLKKFFGKVTFPTKDVRVNIDDASLKIRRLDLPLMPDSEVEEAAKWGLKDTIDGEVEEFSFKHIGIDPLNISVDKKIPLIMFAVKFDAVKKIYDMLEEMGVPRPKVIEPNASALSNIFDYDKGEIRDSFSVMINFGRLLSLFTVMGKKGLIYSRPLAGCAENDLIEQISRDAAMSRETVEQVLKGVEKGEVDPKVQGTVERFFSRFAIEVQRSIDGYLVTFNRAAISDIYVCGRGVYYAGVLKNLTHTLNIPVSLFDPFERIDVSRFSDRKFDETRALFAIACGLAVDS